MKKVLYVLSTFLMLAVILVSAILATSSEIIGGNCGSEGALDTETEALTILGGK